MNLERTELLRVHPRNPDGPLRESLSSLIIRLAWENDVSPAQLLERKYRSQANMGSLTARALGSSVSQSINGNGEFARRIAQRTQQLTHLEHLERSTTISFAGFATFNGLLRDKLAWEPNWLGVQEVKYYPLLWALEPVRVCSATKKPLASICPHCKSRVSALTGGARIARCPSCKGYVENAKGAISSADPLASLIRDFEYELWLSRSLGDFIAHHPTIGKPPTISYPNLLRFWLKKFALKPNSATAKLLGAESAGLFNWLSGDSIPRLRMTLNLCWVFNLSLVEFVTQAAPKNHSGKLRLSVDAAMPRVSVATGRRRIDKPQLEHQLRRILSENQYAMMSLTEIAKTKLKRSDVLIRQMYPALAKSISQRYLHNRALTAQARQEQFCAGIKSFSRCLHAQGRVPNHKTLKPFIDKPSLLRCSWAIAAIREIRAELGYENEFEQLVLPI